MSAALLALWVALIGADRIDFLGGHAQFVLTSFLILTPVVVLSELLRHLRQRHPVRVPRSAMMYAAVVAALLTVVLTSVLDARDVQVSASRAALLVVQTGGTFAIALLCMDRQDSMRILARGAMVCLVLFVLFDVREGFVWIGRAAETMRIGSASITFGNVQNVGPLPRLPGPGNDANRSGFVLLFYGVLIAAGTPRGMLRRVALAFVTVFLILTVSRSATLAAAATIVVTMLTRRLRFSVTPIIATLAAGALVVAFSLVEPNAFGRVVSIVASPATQRLSTNEGSQHGHLGLVARGIREATQSVPRAAIGLGYGNSNLVLQDVFPGNKYGNFHSLYVSMFVEAGILALLLTLTLMLTPLVTGGPWRPMIAGALVFNVFYQLPTEPAFWFALAMAWLTMPRRTLRPRVQIAAPRSATVSSAPEASH
jgi:hypothetical protein